MKIEPRQFKFRVWFKPENRWIETPDGLFFKYPHCSGGEYFGDFISEPYFPQQFTGLYDKNNQPIYEGDILKVKGFDDWFDETIHYYNTIVVFCAGGFKTKTSRALEKADHDKYIGQDLFIHVTEGCEIVGNIFENEELLNEK